MKQKIKNMVNINFVLFFFIVFITSNVLAQGNKVNLFEDINRESNLLNKQVDLLNKIKTRISTKNVKVLKLSNSDLTKYDRIGIPLFDDNMEMAKEKMEVRKANDITWHGKDSKNNYAILVQQNNDITGSIFYNGKKYKIEPLGDGLHAIIEFDEKKLPPEDCKFNDNQINNENLQLKLNKESNLSNKTTTSSIEYIDVLVAYTQSAANASGNINGLIQTAVSEANASYEASNINIRLNLAYSYQVSYSESGKTYDQILNNFQSNSDGYMDEVHSYRNTYSADVCVLIINNTQYCGKAFLPASESNAFCVVHYDCATGYYSFAHEIGHLQGARHNIPDDPNGTYEHGYRYRPSGWRTVMAYDTTDQYGNPLGIYTRLNFFSNPDQTYNGAARGNSTTANNTRKLNETRTDVSGFRAFTLSGALTRNESWRRELTLAGNVTVPSGDTLQIEASTQCNLDGYTIISTGGTITVQNGATINGLCAYLKQGDIIKGLYPTIQAALTAAVSGQTVIVTGTNNISSNLTVPTGVTLNIQSSTIVNLNGYTIISTGGTIICNATINGALLKQGTLHGIYPSIQTALDASVTNDTVAVTGTNSLSADVSIPTYRRLIIAPNATIALNGYKIVTLGRTIIVQNGAGINGAFVETGTSIYGIYASIQAALDASTVNQNNIYVSGSQTLTGNITVPTYRVLYIPSTATVDLNGYSMGLANSSGITVESGAAINGAALGTGIYAVGIYPSIQTAIDNSSSGQTVQLFRNVYNESIYMYKDGVSVVGSGWNSTTVNCYISFEDAANASLKELKSTTGEGNYAFDCSNFTIRKVALMGYSTFSATSSSVNMDSCTNCLNGNTGTWQPINNLGIGSNMTMKRCNFQSVATAFYAGSNSYARVDTNWFCGNQIDIDARAAGSQVYASGNYFSGSPASKCLGNVYYSNCNICSGGHFMYKVSASSTAQTEPAKENTPALDIKNDPDYRDFSDAMDIYNSTQTKQNAQSALTPESFKSEYETVIGKLKKFANEHPDKELAKNAIGQIGLMYRSLNRIEEVKNYANTVLSDNKLKDLQWYAKHLLFTYNKKKQNLQDALALADELIKGTTNDELACLTLIEKGRIYMHLIKDPIKAVECFGKVIKDYKENNITILAEQELNIINKVKNETKKEQQPELQVKEKIKEVTLESYPNPFNPSTVVSYQLSVVSNVKLSIFDMLGREVAVLQDGMKEAGKYSATFDASKLSSGVYFSRLTVNPQEGKPIVLTKKMMLMK